MASRDAEELAEERHDPGQGALVEDPAGDAEPSAGPVRGDSWRDLALPLLEVFLLAAIVALAVALRFRGIRWGTGYFLHPDELFMTNVLVNLRAPSGIREYFNSGTSPLNPFNHGTGFIYGTFPLFAAKFVQSLTSYTDVSTAHIPGRWLSALADTGTVLFVWWTGRMLWGRWTGLLAALLMACTALNIGSAHYFTTDAWSCFFAAGAFAFTLAGWRERRWVFYALAGVMVGLAAASKPNLLAAFGFLFLPLLETVRVSGWRGLLPQWTGSDDEDARSFPVLLASALAIFVAAWTIRIAQPYAFLGPSIFSFRFDPRWLADVEYWRNAQSGELDYPPSIQWAERAPIWFHLKNLVLWGMGPGLGIPALAGFAWWVWTMATGRRWPSWLILGMVGWVGFHIAFFGISLAKTQRYLLPAYPFLVLFAAAAIVAMVGWAWRRGRITVPRLDWSIRPPRWCHPGLILPVLMVGSTVFYGIAFTSVYAHTQTRAAASVWIAENVPDGSSIANEYWDLGLPVGVPELAGHYYDLVQLYPYADETPAKLTQMIGTLERTEYIVLSSNRLIGSIPRMPWRYPMATRYYEALLSGELGFDMVAHFTSYPELFGIEIDDRSAEEALTVYDHPEVMIFRKSDRWNAHAAWYLLNDALGHGGLSYRPVQTAPDRMLLDPAEQQAVREHTSWGSIFNLDSLTNRFPVIAWYVALQILALPVMPLLWRVLPWLPDRGYALAKTLGLTGVAWLTWWIATVRILDFGLVAIAVAWLAVFAASATITWRQAPRFVEDLRRNRWWIGATESLFLAGFLVAAWVRSANPDLWLPGRIGTQIQDMATFTAMVLTPFYPAYDPWLADGTIHDFTFGFMPWAVATRITGIVPEIAFSLSLASMAALVIVNAWYVSALLARRLLSSAPDLRVIGAGLVAPVLLLGIGSRGMAQRVGAGEWGPNYDGSIGDAMRGLWATLTGSPTIPGGAWLATDSFVGTGTLEFPLLSYLTGEMAMQQLALPLLLAGLVVVVGFLGREAGPAPGDYRVLEALGGWRESGTFLAVAGLVTGWALAANLFFGFVLLATAGLLVVLAVGARVGWASSWAIVRDSGVAIGVVAVVAVASVAPFLASYGYLATQRSPVFQPLRIDAWFGHFWPVLVAIVSYLLWQLWSLFGHAREIGAVGWPGSIGCWLMMAAALGLAYVIGVVAIFILLLVLVAGFVVWHRSEDMRHLAIVGFATTAFGLCLAANRFVFTHWTSQENVPLQFSLAAWVLLAVLAGPIAALAIGTAWERAPRLAFAGKRGLAVAWTIVLAVAVAAGAVYPVLGFPQRADERLAPTANTLDSMAFMNDGQLALNPSNSPTSPYDLAPDLAAIDWMRDNLQGRPTILEVPAQVNGWGGRVSALTGFPAVLGSVPVQMQQRPGMDRLITWRNNDINTVYGSVDGFAAIEPILLDYGVQVIYVGPLERVSYSAESLAKFDEAAAGGSLDVIYEADGVTIYAYNGGRLPRAPYDP